MPWALPVAVAAQAGAGIWGASKADSAANKNRRAQNSRNAVIDQGAADLMQDGAGDWEKIISDFLQSVNAPLNVGSDPGMQSLRADPMGSSANAMNSRFNLPEMFAQLQPIRDRELTGNVNEMRAGAGSLGQRFGGATMNQERLLRENSMQDRNADVLQLGQLGLADRSQQDQMLMSLLGLGSDQERFRTQNNTNLLGIRAGIQPGQFTPSAMPGAAGGIAQLLMFLPMLQSMMTQQGGTK